VPDEIPGIVAVVPLPIRVLPPGLSVTVQLPAEGKPLKATLPVATAQVGCVINPTIGGAGAEGGEGIVTSDEGDDVHKA
jgi:hypothetical protein